MNATEVALLALGCVLVARGAARADAPPTASTERREASADTMAAAQALFVEGRRLVVEGRYVEGCAKLEQSKRLDPAPGTQMNLADCFEKSGKVASAWLAFHEASAAAQRSGRADWAKLAQERAHVIEPRVPSLTLVIDEAAPGLVVRRDGVVVEALGSPVPVDSGVYEIVATAPRRRAWTVHVAVDTSTHVVLHVPALSEEPTALRPVPPVAIRRLTPSAGPRQRTIAIVTGLVALAPLALGSYFGVRAFTRNDSASNLCPSPPRCLDARAVELTGEARSDAAVSNVLFIAAGTLLGTAASLYFTAPAQGGNAPLSLGVTGATASLLGRW